jgi:hypothetical protein
MTGLRINQWELKKLRTYFSFVFSKKKNQVRLMFQPYYQIVTPFASLGFRPENSLTDSVTFNNHNVFFGNTVCNEIS